MATVNEKMTAIADAIRAKTGGTDALTLDGMAEAIAGIEAGGGNTNIYTTEMVFAEETASAILEHNLGKIPDYVVVVQDSNSAFTNDGVIAIHSTSSAGSRLLGSTSTSKADGYANVEAWGINSNLGDFVSADKKNVYINVPSATMKFPAGHKIRAFVGVNQ